MPQTLPRTRDLPLPHRPRHADCRPGLEPSLEQQNQLLDNHRSVNAVAETFFATLKKELVHRRSWPERDELRREVFDYIEIFSNATRRHSTLGMLSPARYEEQNDSLKQLNITNNS